MWKPLGSTFFTYLPKPQELGNLCFVPQMKAEIIIHRDELGSWTPERTPKALQSNYWEFKNHEILKVTQQWGQKCDVIKFHWMSDTLIARAYNFFQFCCCSARLFCIHGWFLSRGSAYRSCRHSIPVQNKKICNSDSRCGNIYLCFPQVPTLPFYCKCQILCWFKIWTQEESRIYLQIKAAIITLSWFYRLVQPYLLYLF